MSAWRLSGCAAVLAAALLLPGLAGAEGVDAPLDGLIGDANRGRAIVTDRRKGLCLLCHSGPFPEERFHGNLAPSLAGAGARLSEAELRLRVIDSRRINPVSIMPAYQKTEGLHQVAAPYRNKPILSAQEVEDVIAFLKTLR